MTVTVANVSRGRKSRNPFYAVVEGSRIPKSAIPKRRPAATRHSGSGTTDWRDQDALASHGTVNRDDDDILLWE